MKKLISIIIVFFCLTGSLLAASKVFAADTSNPPSVTSASVSPGKTVAGSGVTQKMTIGGNADYYRIYIWGEGGSAHPLTGLTAATYSSSTELKLDTYYYIGKYFSTTTFSFKSPKGPEGIYWLYVNAEYERMKPGTTSTKEIYGCDHAGKLYTRDTDGGPLTSITGPAVCKNTSPVSFEVTASGVSPSPEVGSVPSVTSIGVPDLLAGAPMSVSADATGEEFIKLYLHDSGLPDTQKATDPSYDPDLIKIKTFHLLGNSPQNGKYAPTTKGTYKIAANAESALNSAGERLGCDWQDRAYIRRANGTVSYTGSCSNYGLKSFTVTYPQIDSLSLDKTSVSAGATATDRKVNVSASGRANKTWFYISKTKPSTMTSVAVLDTYNPATALAANTFYRFYTSDGTGTAPLVAPSTAGTYYIVANAHTSKLVPSPWHQYDRVCSWEKKLFKWENGAKATGESCTNTPGDSTTLTVTTTQTPTVTTDPGPTGGGGGGRPPGNPSPTGGSGGTCPSLPTNTGAVTLNFNVSEGGSYIVWSRMKASSSSNNSYWLQIDSGCGINVGDTGVSSSSWTWVDYKNGSSSRKVTVSLQPGSHIIRLIGRESNVQVDRLFLIDSESGCKPTGTGNNCSGVNPSPTGGPTGKPNPTSRPPEPTGSFPNPTSRPNPTDGTQPTPDPSGSPNPTVPPPTACSTPGQCAKVDVTLILHGVGIGGDTPRPVGGAYNPDPQNQQRSITVSVFNT
ncbi:MAG TPA: hypothetical protein VJC10_03350, partial [Patescibacteria group bacterium]|nr:hypothetical protein [Patescibacteria group bacterium]